MLPPTKRDGVGAPASPKVRFEPKPGNVVDGKYVVERVIGEGGMGVVVAATHLGLDQRVAIKFLTREAMRNREAVERFQREAKAAAKVRSEHVARVHDVGTVEGGGPYIVMEYLEGSDLGQIIDEGGKLPTPEACEIALQACEALAEVHAAGIVHRDLKPSNLFVTRRSDGSPSVKLLDFGISKFVSDDVSVDPALTATATLMGSPSYMSPEQLKSTKEIDARSDVWSLGAVLYEALTGKPAFRAETVPQVCAMIASDDPVPPSSLNAHLPVELERAVLACLQKRPEKRSTLLELACVLAKYSHERGRASLERIDAVVGPSEQRPRVPTPPPSEDRKLPILRLARAERTAAYAETEISTGEDRMGRRGGVGPLAFLVLLAASVFGAGLYLGKIKVKQLREEVASATNLVASAVESALPLGSASSPPQRRGPTPSAKPPPASTPVVEPPSSASARMPVEPPNVPSSSSSDETSEEQAPGPSSVPAPVPPSIAGAPPSAYPTASPAPHASAPPKKHPPKPRHGGKAWKKHR